MTVAPWFTPLALQKLVEDRTAVAASEWRLAILRNERRIFRAKGEEMIIAKSPIGPNEKKFYGLDWSGVVESGDVIAASVWNLTGTAQDQEQVQADYNGQVSRVRLTGGTAGTTYLWHNLITTASGDQFEETLQINCADK